MEKVNIPGWGEPQIVRESQGVRVGVRDGFWTEGEASDSERVVKTLLLSTTSVLFYIYVESSTIDCRIRLYNEMQRCSARPDKSQLESGEVHWNMLIYSSCNVLIHWKFQWNVLLHFSHNAFLIVLAQLINSQLEFCFPRL